MGIIQAGPIHNAMQGLYIHELEPRRQLHASQSTLLALGSLTLLGYIVLASARRISLGVSSYKTYLLFFHRLDVPILEELPSGVEIRLRACKVIHLTKRFRVITRHEHASEAIEREHHAYLLIF